MAKVRGGQDDSQTFAQQVARIDSTKWPGPIGFLFLGRLTPVQAQVAASSSDPVKEKGQRCEAEFYSGEYMMMQKDAAGALPHFKEARSICPPDFVEYGAARVALQQLESPASAPAPSR
jgi:lipoprotein NlpI